MHVCFFIRAFSALPMKECMVSSSGVNVILCTVCLSVCVPGFPREHCVVLVVTAKKQLADDRAALLSNRCHERRGASRSWMVLSVFSLHAHAHAHTLNLHIHTSLSPHTKTNRDAHTCTRRFTYSHSLYTHTY